MDASARIHLFSLEKLCNRAIASPSSTTPVEKARIQGRLNSVTDNSLCVAETSLSLSELIAKALASSLTLNPDEAKILAFGPVNPASAEKIISANAYHALTDEQRNLQDRDSNLVSDQQEQRAFKIGWEVLYSARAEGKRVKRPSGLNPTMETPLLMPRPLLPGVNQSSSPGNDLTGHYLFARKSILYRASRCCDQRKTTLLPGLHSRQISLLWQLKRLLTYLDPPLQRRSVSGIFEAEDALARADHARILASYSQLLEERKVEDGYLWGHFITADEKVLEIYGDGKREWILPVWEAAWKAGEVGVDGWPGALAMKAELVFGTLMLNLVRGEQRPLE
ncbi:MAG: hypothetical protein Q9173_004296 [Seirophora scorigena]